MTRSFAIAGNPEALAGNDALTKQMEESEFRAIYQDFAPRLRSYLRRAVGPSGDAALADDLLQETFLKLLRGRIPAAVIADERQLRAYLYRMATNLLNDHWRRRQRERRWSLLRFFGGDARPTPRIGTDELETNRLSIDTSRAFAKLKPQEQSLLWLAYVEGFDHGEIATALSVGEASVRVLLFRARRRLAEMLKDQE